MVRGKSFTGHPPKRELRGIKQHIDGKGPPPFGLIEAQLVERFGWTFSQLDQEDEARALRAVQYLNLSAGYQRVKDAVAQHATDAVSQGVWAAWKVLMDAEVEDE